MQERKNFDKLTVNEGLTSYIVHVPKENKISAKFKICITYKTILLKQ